MKNLLFTAFTLIFSISLISQTDILPPVLDKPANAGTNQMPDVQLDWFAVNGIGEITYEVRLDSSDLFPNPVIFFTSTTAQKTENLLFGNQYFWKVRAMASADTSDWSVTRSFTILSFVALESPEDEEVAQMPDVTVEWSNKKGATYITGLNYYDLQVSLTSDFTNPPYIVDSVAFGTFPANTDFYEFKTSNLLFDTTYYWRVRARHSLDVSDWSQIWSFTTADGVMLSSPANMEIFDRKTDQVGFLCAKLFDSYNLSKSIDTINDNIISIEFDIRAEKNNVKSLHFKVLDSLKNTIFIVYFGDLGFIEAYDGTTITQIMPYDGGSTENKWYTVKAVLDLNLLNYDIFINDVQKADDFSFYENISGFPSEFVWYNYESIANVGWIDDVSIYSDSELYFTEGFESGNLIKGNWSVEIPKDQDPNVELQWEQFTGVSEFIYQVCKDPQFAFPCLTGFVETNSAVVESLDFGATYYYRIMANHISDTTDWSITGKFDIINTVILNSPANGASGLSNLPTLKWNYIRGADQYELQWYNEDYSVNDTAMVDTSFFLMFKPLDQGEDIFWKVRAIHNIDTTNWSDIWQFHTGPQDAGEISLKKEVINLFPNPTNGILQIKLNSVKQTNIQITILDFVGKVVFEDMHSFEQGSETLKVNLSGLSDGLYFIRFRSGETVYTEKLIIDK